MYALSSIVTQVPVSDKLLFSDLFFQPWMISGLYVGEQTADGQKSIRKYANSAILFQDHLILIDVQQTVLSYQDRAFELSQAKCLETFRLGLWKTRRLWSKINDLMQDGFLYMDENCQHKIPDTVKKITKICLTLAFTQEEPNEFKSIPHSYYSIYDDAYFELSTDENPLLVYSFLDFAEIISQLKSLPELSNFFNYHRYVIAEHPDFGSLSEISLLEQYYSDRSVGGIEQDSMVQGEQFQTPWSVQASPPNTKIDHSKEYSRLPRQIERPDLQSRAQKSTTGLLIALLLTLWIYICLPIFAVIAWVFGFYRFHHYAILNYHHHTNDLYFCLFLISFFGIIFMIWALFYRFYHRFKWRRVEKKAVENNNHRRVSRQEMMRYFEITNLNVHVARNHKICVLNFDESGKIVDISGKMLPILLGSLTEEQKIAEFTQGILEQFIAGKISQQDVAQQMASYVRDRPSE